MVHDSSCWFSLFICAFDVGYHLLEMKEFEMSMMGDCKPIATLLATSTALDPEEEGEAVDQREYRSMIGSLLYLTASRPDIHFAVYLCPRFQASPRTSHRQAVKRSMVQRLLIRLHLTAKRCDSGSSFYTLHLCMVPLVCLA